MEISLTTVTKTVQLLVNFSKSTRHYNSLTFPIVRLDMVEVVGSSPIVRTNLTRNDSYLGPLSEGHSCLLIPEYNGFWQILVDASCYKNRAVTYRDLLLSLSALLKKYKSNFALSSLSKNLNQITSLILGGSNARQRGVIGVS